MTDEAPPPDEGKRARRRPKWSRTGIVVTFVVIVVVPMLVRGVFDIWRHAVVPDDAPHIAMSLDDTWLNDLGITRATYEQALARAGGKLFSLSPEDVGEAPVAPGRIREILAGMDALLLTGGGDVDPGLYGGAREDATGVSRARDDFEIALIREARRRRLPILGICRGCQILNVAHGGTLRNLRSEDALREMHFNFDGHAVALEPESALAGIVETNHLESVESFHGQAVGTPGQEVRVVARSDDGVIEAIEIGEEGVEWIVAVQWHPELTVLDDKQQALLRAFVEAAARRE